MKKIKNYINQFSLGVAVILSYFLLPYIEYVVVYLAKGYTFTPTMSISLSLIIQILTISVVVLLFNKKIKKDFQDLKKNHKEYFSKYFKYWLLALAIMSVSNILISLINGGQIAGNEEAVRNIFSKTPVYMFISAVFFAPVTEEFVFRQGIRNIFSNDKVFIIISGLLFGGLHVFGSVNNWMDLLYLIPYCAPGFIFAYILSKTDNIFVSTGLHFLHNGIMMSLQILLLLLGQM